MKECWINVYQGIVSGAIWYGGNMASKAQAIGDNGSGLILNRLLYRIHVRLK